MNRLFKKFFQRSTRRPIRKGNRLGAGFGPLEDRTLMSVTASLQAGVLHIEGSVSGDTITVRHLNNAYSVDGLMSTFADVNVQSIRIDGRGGNDRINLHTEGTQTIGNPGANFVGPAQNPITVTYAPITVPTQIIAGDGADIIDGGEGPDAIFGRGGADTVRGWNGNDYIDGGLGNDTLLGGAGMDVIFGDFGNDTIDGGADFDRITGGPDSNSIADSPLTNQILGNDLFQGIVVDPTLRERVRFGANDGVVSRTDLFDAFTAVEADGIVSFNEYHDLQRIEDVDASLGFTDSERVLFNKVLNYDAGNKLFGGQVLEADGRLHENDSAYNLSRLVDKWFKGLDHPLAQSRDLSQTFPYALATAPLFRMVPNSGSGNPGNTLVGGPSATHPEPAYTDVFQGSTPDCFFTANLAAVARNTPQAIVDMFGDNGDGTYTVRFFINGKADYVTVDRQLPVSPTGLLEYAGFAHSATAPDTYLWVSLAEKAYVQMNGSGTIGQDGTNSYQGIAFGPGPDAFTHITNESQSVHDFGGSLAATKAAIIAELNAGKVVTYATPHIDNPGQIESKHLYFVMGYDVATDTFRLFNPYGVNGRVLSDGHIFPGYLSLTVSQMAESGVQWFGQN